MNFNPLVLKLLNNEIEKVLLEYNMLFLNEVEVIEVSYCAINNHFILKSNSSGYYDYLTVAEFNDYLNLDDVKVYELVNFICT